MTCIHHGGSESTEKNKTKVVFAFLRVLRVSVVNISYIENELPQPQVLLAFGLLMLKPLRFSSSW